MTPVVHMTEIGRTFAGPPEVHAVREVDLTVSPGEYLSIVGPSGSVPLILVRVVRLPSLS